nr:hypothetical protein [Kibdelosporangium sp. MJ126-NF4]CEL13664.1 hypothetical protein [Kibdelosporangium sp. MJ126-NF4]CTQ99350.1 hypothetical protein [Kibdelosporangium sp. MJ126-NF4]
MAITTWVQAAGTLLLGLVGLWFAHNYRRQIRLKLAERQVESYMRLWTLTASATPFRTTPLQPAELTKLYDDMGRWYFDDGDGMLASAAVRNLFVGVHTNLTCPIAAMKPSVLAAQLVALPHAEAERRRGCAVIRQVSLLRTQLKRDLAMHFGVDYYSDLHPEDRAFLVSCGMSPRRRPWRGPWLRPADRTTVNACVCGACPGVSGGCRTSDHRG